MRVAEERGETIGQRVGYTIRLESRRSRDTRILFCTTGVVLRLLQENPTLSGVSHIFIDEVHERAVDSDFLLLLVRRILRTRSDLKVLLCALGLFVLMPHQY